MTLTDEEREYVRDANEAAREAGLWTRTVIARLLKIIARLTEA
jgi:hypothetical protein